MRVFSTLLLLVAFGIFFWVLPFPLGFSFSRNIAEIFAPTEQISSVLIHTKDRSFSLQRKMSGTSPCPLLEKAEEASVGREHWELMDYPGVPLERRGLYWLTAFRSEFRSLDSFVPSDYSPFEFDQSSLELEYVLDSGMIQKFSFGKVNTYLDARYVKTTESPRVFLLPLAGAPKSLKNEYDLISNRPLNFQLDSVLGLSLEREGEKVSFFRNGEGWEFGDSHRKPRGSQLTNVLRTLVGFRSRKFFPESAVGSRSDDVRLVVTREDAPALEVSLYPNSGDSDGGFLRVKGCSCVYYGNVSSLLGLEASREFFLDRRLLPFEPQAVERLRLLTSRGQNLVLERQGEEWLVNGREGDRVFIENYLKRIAALEAEKYLDELDQAVFASPVVSLFVELAGKGGKKSQKSLIVSRDSNGRSGQWLASSDNMREFFQLSSKTLKDLLVEEDVLLAASKNSQ